MQAGQEFQDVIELAKGPQFIIVLDENLRTLKTGLEHEGYKVVMPSSKLTDAELKDLAKGGWTILTANSRDFIDDAVHYDYDVIAVENIRFIDSKPDRSNQTVVKIADAIRRSQLATRKGAHD